LKLVLVATILYVDDERPLLDIGKFFLEKSGFVVKTADSAIKALELLKTTHFDVIVSDYKMPEMDGIEFLKIVRRDHPPIPFIIFTGKGREEVVIQVFENGANSYIQKGGDPKSQFAELNHKIHTAIQWVNTEKECNVNLKKYKILFDLFPMGITISDKFGNIIESNEAAENLLGLAKEEQEKRRIDDTEWYIIRPDGSPMPPEEFASVRALKENQIVSNVAMGIVKDNGNITWMTVTAVPIREKGYGVAIIYDEIFKYEPLLKEVIKLSNGRNIRDFDLVESSRSSSERHINLK
jgi:PAS domain S-box-containing protein